MMDLDKQPGIRFIDILLAKETFERIPEYPDQVTVNLEFKYNFSKADDYIAELTTVVTCQSESGENVLTLESQHIGIFDVVQGEENMGIDEFMVENAPALMFPFVREHIYSVTKKAGVNPIALPPVNIRAMISNKKTEETPE